MHSCLFSKSSFAANYKIRLWLVEIKPAKMNNEVLPVILIEFETGSDLKVVSNLEESLYKPKAFCLCRSCFIEQQRFALLLAFQRLEWQFYHLVASHLE